MIDTVFYLRIVFQELVHVPPVSATGHRGTQTVTLM
jgi:hypothetical protein